MATSTARNKRSLGKTKETPEPDAYLLKDEGDIKNKIIQCSPIPQFVIDKNHCVTHWNSALEKYSGIKAEKIIGTSQQWKAFYLFERPIMADLIVDGAIDKIPQWYAGKYAKSKLINGAYEATDFFRLMGKAGTWLHFTAAPILDAHGNVIGAVETLEDISEIKKKEEDLKTSEERFRSVGEDQTEFIWEIFFKPFLLL